MGLLSKIFNNTRKPVGFFGKLMVSGMNGGSHARLAEWGLSHVAIGETEAILDVGCGGGANVARLLKLSPSGHVTGLDYSGVSVAKSLDVNARAISDGRCTILRGDAAALPFEDGSFDLITAFETIYFWPGLDKCFAEVKRVLRPGGRFLIVNESDGKNEKSLKWTNIIDGMTVYTAEDLSKIFHDLDFGLVNIDDDVAGDRLCAVAVKQTI